jgi:anti-sigma factor RsiW
MRDPAEMTCRELVELVTDYLEGVLPSADRRRFEAHLTECSGCRAYVDQMRQTIRLLGKLPPELITEEQEQDLLRVFRDWKSAAR